MVLLSKTNEATIFLLCNNPLVKDHATMVLLPKAISQSIIPTQHSSFVQHKRCHVHMLWNPPFSQLYVLSQGDSIALKKTHAIVHKGSCLHFVKVHIFLFYKYHTQYRLCFRNTTFFTKVLLCCLFTH